MYEVGTKVKLVLEKQGQEIEYSGTILSIREDKSEIKYRISAEGIGDTFEIVEAQIKGISSTSGGPVSVSDMDVEFTDLGLPYFGDTATFKDVSGLENISIDNEDLTFSGNFAELLSICNVITNDGEFYDEAGNSAIRSDYPYIPFPLYSANNEIICLFTEGPYTNYYTKFLIYYKDKNDNNYIYVSSNIGSAIWNNDIYYFLSEQIEDTLYPYSFPDIELSFDINDYSYMFTPGWYKLPTTFDFSIYKNHLLWSDSHDEEDNYRHLLLWVKKFYEFLKCGEPVSPPSISLTDNIEVLDSGLDDLCTVIGDISYFDGCLDEKWYFQLFENKIEVIDKPASSDITEVYYNNDVKQFRTRNVIPDLIFAIDEPSNLIGMRYNALNGYYITYSSASGSDEDNQTFAFNLISKNGTVLLTATDEESVCEFCEKLANKLYVVNSNGVLCKVINTSINIVSSEEAVIYLRYHEPSNQFLSTFEIGAQLE